MIEITSFYFEVNFESVLKEVSLGKKFIVKMPDGNAVILTNNVDESIQISQKRGWIEPL